MYVDDIEDIEELKFLRSQVEMANAIYHTEQNRWDLEDIERRIKELTA
ncbi:hypothetical protein SEA_STEAMY_81 [Mycobacterium phage Steamy]|uniref:Uncharacterized protein n=1 Tax=Mycobacterium phage Steamy TaxID=2250309 RepID=A0A345L0Q3_9CAUD|nr:hypothetical protein KIV62_gp20 [Mycobacterium phage Steamy]AXH48855.1 hypothetical protein SEA_STEAMY_81 [Mycobacterium phage Steamy]